MNIKYFFEADKDKVAIMATDSLNNALGNMFRSGEEYLLLLSGGSALKLLEGIDLKLINSKATIAVLDERYDKENSNFSQIKKTTFFKEVVKNGCKYFDSEIQEVEDSETESRRTETQEEMARRMNKLFSDWIAKNPDGAIIATVGIGPDGHISGIMPFDNIGDKIDNDSEEEKFAKLFNGEVGNEYVVGYDAKLRNPIPLRVTTTFKLLRNIDLAIVFALDKDKALSDLYLDGRTLSQTPAKILLELPMVNLYTNIA